MLRDFPVQVEGTLAHETQPSPRLKKKPGENALWPPLGGKHIKIHGVTVRATRNPCSWVFLFGLYLPRLAERMSLG